MPYKEIKERLEAGMLSHYPITRTQFVREIRKNCPVKTVDIKDRNLVVDYIDSRNNLVSMHIHEIVMIDNFTNIRGTVQEYHNGMDSVAIQRLSSTHLNSVYCITHSFLNH